MNYWGRIFFIHDQQTDQLQTIKGQPLENHVGNCHRLLEHFDSNYVQENSSTKERLMQAVKQHDEGKQTTFKLKQENGKFLYSFSGHRFKVPGHDPYVDALIRSHHEFSVERINRERAKFAKGSDERKHFADDLYLLCMADQLEAELAVKTVEDKPGGLPRTFMEFVTECVAQQAQPIFTVVPWPFVPDELTLTFALRVPGQIVFKNLSAKALQEIFEKTRHFDEEQITIFLRGT